MNQIQKVVLNKDENLIIFIYPDVVVAFCYDMHIYGSVDKPALQQFINEFAGGGDGDANYMSHDLIGYIREPISTYESEINHPAAVVVYTIENGFGIQ